GGRTTPEPRAPGPTDPDSSGDLRTTREGRLMSFLQAWREYRRFRALPRREREVVFFSESRQDWHHFEPVLAQLTGELNRTVLYVSSDPDDPGLATGSDRIRPFCVGRGLWRIWFFQFLDADVLVTQIL